MLSRLPIKLTAPVAIAAPVLVLGLLLSGLWYAQSTRAVTDIADQSIEQIHEHVSTHVDTLLSIPVRVCRLNEHLVRTGALPTGDLAAWRPTLFEQARAFDMLSAITWGDADGRSAWISRYADGSLFFALKDDPAADTMLEWRVAPDGSIPATPTNEFAFDLYTRPWFTTPRDAGEAGWSEPFVWVGGADADEPTLGLAYGIPMRHPDGSLHGVIDADFSLNDLSTFLSTLEIGKTGFAVLATLDGRLLAASNDTPITTPGGERVDAAESPDPRIVAAAATIGDAEAVRGEHAEITVGGTTYYLRASPIGRAVGLDWTLATIVPEADFTAGIERGFRRSALISIVAILAAIALGVGASMLLVRPIVAAVTYARRIGQGDLETRVALSGSTELVHLGDELDRMVSGLRDRVRMREALSLAMEVQQNLLPAEPPRIEGLDIAGHSTYCDETGGDYYDFLDIGGLDESTAAIALGDVAGHGIAAAMLMATARGILRSRAAQPGSLGDLLAHLNGLLVADADGHRFMTMLLITVSATRGEFRWASAGHGPPSSTTPPASASPTWAGATSPSGSSTTSTSRSTPRTHSTPGRSSSPPPTASGRPWASARACSGWTASDRSSPATRTRPPPRSARPSATPSPASEAPPRRRTTSPSSSSRCSDAGDHSPASGSPRSSPRSIDSTRPTSSCPAGTPPNTNKLTTFRPRCTTIPVHGMLRSPSGSIAEHLQRVAWSARISGSG
jgi:sigma-B regulation protein RsbU (phosphoserine phosphatase)